MSESTEKSDKSIEINDLPPEETLTPEEKEELAGAGRFRPTFEALESRQMMTASPLLSPILLSDPQAGYVQTMPASPDQQVEVIMPAAVLQGGATGADLSGQDLTSVDMSKIDLRGAILRNCNLTGVNLSNLDLRGADFTGANLTKTIMIGADLSQGADGKATILTGALLFDTNLTKANLTGAKFSADLDTAYSEPATLTRAILSGADLRFADFLNVQLGGNSNDLSGADLRGANLYGADLRNLNLSGADLSVQNLSEADLSESNLSGAILTDTTLTRTTLSHADLTDTVLSEKNLTGAILIGADLTRADLTKATLTDADLSGATLEETSLLGANLTRANLSGLDMREGKLKTSAEFTLSKNPLLGCTLTGADLSKVNLSDTDLSGMDLSILNLRGAIMVNTRFVVTGNMTPWDFAADLHGSDLREADLSGAVLSWVDLRLADLRDADLRAAKLNYTDREGADLRGADLTGAEVGTLTRSEAKALFIAKAGNESAVSAVEVTDIPGVVISTTTTSVTNLFIGPREESDLTPPTTENDLVRVRPNLSLPSLGEGVDTLGGGIDANGNLIAGASDSSAATVYTSSAGEKFLFVAGDEDQNIRLYKFDVTEGEYKFVKAWDFTNSLGLTDTSHGTPREMDIEAVAMSGDKLYWIGSGSNRKAKGRDETVDVYTDAPNRDRIFRTDITEVNGQPQLNFVGYTRIEEALFAHLPSLKDAARGDVNPKTTAGYNIEGLVNLPDHSVGISFRASGTESALIVPIKNLDDMITSGAAARFGEDIQLDLGGRGIRDIMGSTYKDANGIDQWQYLIIAGPAGAATGIGSDDFRLYTWTGNAADTPVMHDANLFGMTPEAIVLPESNAKWDANTQFGLISDNGATMFDNNILGKDQAPLDKKSRIDYVTLGAANIRTNSTPELTGTRRQDNLQGEQTFTFESSGETGFIEVLGPGRNKVKIEVGYMTTDGFVKVAESSFDYKNNDTNIVYLAQPPAGQLFTVRITEVESDSVTDLRIGSSGEAVNPADSGQLYTLSWKV